MIYALGAAFGAGIAWILMNDKKLVKGKDGLIFVTPVDDKDHWLRVDAAQAFVKMSSAAKAQGVYIEINPGLTAYRSEAEQASLIDGLGAYSSGGLAAPVNKSNHRAGIALDLNVKNTVAQNWLRTNGPKFGWYPVGESFQKRPEPWHYEYKGV